MELEAEKKRFLLRKNFFSCEQLLLVSESRRIMEAEKSFLGHIKFL